MSAYRALLTSTSRARLTTNSVRYQNVRHYSSPFKVFMDTIKEQMSKSKDIKNLQDESGRLNDSEALKKAKEMFEKAKVKLEKTRICKSSVIHIKFVRLNNQPNLNV